MTSTQLVLTIFCGITVLLFCLFIQVRIKLKSTLATLSDLEYSKSKVDETCSQLLKQLQESSTSLDQTTKTLNDYQTQYFSIIDIDDAINSKKLEQEQICLKIQELNDKYKAHYETYLAIQEEIALYSPDIETMEYGLYKPQFDFVTSEEYKQTLDKNYLRQKDCIRSGNAVECHTQWEVGGSKSEGTKMTKKYSKLMLYAFNGECDSLIAKIRWNNATRTKERILKAFESINKLGESHNINITIPFLDLKLEEMALSHEYENKKYEEKEEQRRIREQMREEEKVLKDIERAQREAEEEERMYQKALSRVKNDLKFASPAEVEVMNEQIKQLEGKLEEAQSKRERALSMAQQTKVGHIYVISNIGSFGEDVYKIGMTRRLEPMDRIRELGDASVPFYFDVHAIIYSENAPQLEYELHKEFQSRRLNRVNGRKEFFKISLDEIETFVNQHAGAEIEFTKIAEAKEYRETIAMLNSLMNAEQEIIKEHAFPATLE